MSDFSRKHAQSGRPKKKPEYCKETKIAELVKMAVSHYQLPYDDRDERPEEAPTLLSVAELLNTTSSKVRKLLITADFFTSEKSREINSLSEQGLSLTEIAERMELSKSTVCDYLPYSRGVYNLEDATLCAEQGRIFRARKRACEELEKHPDDEQYLWQAIKAFENYPFRIQKPSEEVKRFQYTIQDERMCISGVEFSREAIYRAFRKARTIQCSEGAVDRSERLECIGACELYTVFLRIGACQAKADEK